MNIVTPIPTSLAFTTANVNTESARRDNVLRETVPQTSASENSAAETGLGSESDRVKRPGQQPQPVTYERPQSSSAQEQTAQTQDGINKDNGEDPSAGRENAEARQEQQQQRADQQKIDELEARDREVRAHEQAHAARGGQYAGAPTYEFETGPNGQQYAVGGEVSIDISEEGTPEETLRKMQQVRAAALAPAEPSPQDLRVATEAAQRSAEARSEIATESREEADRLLAEQRGEEQQSQTVGPELDDIVRNNDVGPPTRSLKEDPVAEAAGLETPSEDFQRQLANRDATVLQTVNVLENFYAGVSTPRETGLQISA